MTLKTMPPKPQVFIGFGSNFLKSVHQDENTALYIFKNELSAYHPEYQFDVHPIMQKNGWVLKIINAHLNYEAVAYIDNQIEYPYVKNAINEHIRDLLESTSHLDYLASAEELSEVEKSKVRYQQFQSAESMIEELNSHMRSCRSNFIFKLNYSDIPEVWLISNNSGGLLMYASHETAVQTLKKAGSLADEIAANATRLGINFVLKCGQPKLNQFSSVILPDFNEENAKNNREAIILVREFLECLQDIDTYHQIPEQQKTVWDIYFYSFKTAAINKIKEIAYGIKTD